MTTMNDMKYTRSPAIVQFGSVVAADTARIEDILLISLE